MTNELQANASDVQVYQDENGKYVRRAVYTAFSSVKPETKEQKIALLNLLESDDIATPMETSVGSQIEVENVIFSPYDSIDEENGTVTNGVLTYLIDPKGVAYVTSSKSVYFTLKRVMTVFGEAPFPKDDLLKVEIVKKQGKKFKYTDVKVIG